jgi:hypothetical protein
MTTAIALAGTLACLCFWRLRLARVF